MKPTLDDILEDDRRARRLAGLIADYLRPASVVRPAAWGAEVPSLLSVAEFAAAAGLHEETVRGHIRTGQLPPERVSLVRPYQIQSAALPAVYGVPLDAAAERLAAWRTPRAEAQVVRLVPVKREGGV
jgi:hypothetical protein